MEEIVSWLGKMSGLSSGNLRLCSSLFGSSSTFSQSNKGLFSKYIFDVNENADLRYPILNAVIGSFDLLDIQCVGSEIRSEYNKEVVEEIEKENSEMLFAVYVSQGLNSKVNSFVEPSAKHLILMSKMVLMLEEIKHIAFEHWLGIRS